jgi:hypothetical protein
MGIFHLEMPHMHFTSFKASSAFATLQYACWLLWWALYMQLCTQQQGSSCPQTTHILHDLETETKSLKHRTRHTLQMWHQSDYLHTTDNLWKTNIKFNRVPHIFTRLYSTIITPILQPQTIWQAWMKSQGCALSQQKAVNATLIFFRLSQNGHGVARKCTYYMQALLWVQ